MTDYRNHIDVLFLLAQRTKRIHAVKTLWALVIVCTCRMNSMDQYTHKKQVNPTKTALLPDITLQNKRMINQAKTLSILRLLF
ncbi:hypothetical protein LH51_10650 [Nitrincola sp. A-D6]|nr:hypothetical protein LH51_10650 [Nitrincola sp. A-D6]